MGRFRAEAVLIRRLPDLNITFYDKDKIYIVQRGYSNITLFHRWFAPRGSYQNSWGPFRRQLLRQKHLTVRRCFELADRYGVLFVCTDRPPNFKGKTIKYRDY